MENFGDVESRGYYANIWELTAIWLVRFLLRRSKLQATQFLRTTNTFTVFAFDNSM